MAEQPTPFFRTRGVVLTPQDLTLSDWPERAKRAGLTTIALHPTPAAVTEFVQSAVGESFLAKCDTLGLEIEYELHAIGELLPRSLFDHKPHLFRMNDAGERVPDSNLCVHAQEALDVAAANAVAIAQTLRPTTSRYFYWGDDGRPWCHCPKCKGLSDTDQALILENRILAALRDMDPSAELAHLAYLNTLSPPEAVEPAPGVFLEFAPIKRRFDVAIDAPENRQHIEFLEANLRVFSAESAQALEYWLDCSLFSKWKRPAVRIPWAPEVVVADLAAYRRLGVRHITTFAVYVDHDYVTRFGEPPIEAYGELLCATLDSSEAVQG